MASNEQAANVLRLRAGIDSRILEAGAVALVSMAGYLLVLKTFWFHDDWYFLANAAGLANLDKGGSRWISYVGYWKLLFPIFGINPIGWAVSRLLLHFIASLLVFRISLQCRLPRGASLFSAIVFASSPVAFESLYWGTGAIELMGAVFTLAAINQWLRQTDRSLVLAVAFGVMSVWSKEIGMFLPLFFMAHLFFLKKKSGSQWVASFILLFSTMIAGILLLGDLSGGLEYQVGIGSIFENFLMLGFWFVAPPQFQMGSEVGVIWTLFAGGMVWALWAVFSIFSIRKKQFLPVVLLAVCISSLIPVLPLKDHIVPRYDYGPVAAFAVLLGFALQRFLVKPRVGLAVIFVLAAVIYSGWGTHYRQNAKHPRGRLVHRLVLKEEISRKTSNKLLTLDLMDGDRLVFFIEPTSNAIETQYLQESLGETLGPALLLGGDKEIKWTTSLEVGDVGAFVISVNGLVLQPMGRYKPRKR